MDNPNNPPLPDFWGDNSPSRELLTKKLREQAVAGVKVEFDPATTADVPPERLEEIRVSVIDHLRKEAGLV